MDVVFIIILFVVCVGGCWLIFTTVGGILFGKSDKSTFVDKTTHIHNHYHDNRSVHVDGEKIKNIKK